MKRTPSSLTGEATAFFLAATLIHSPGEINTGFTHRRGRVLLPGVPKSARFETKAKTTADNATDATIVKLSGFGNSKTKNLARPKICPTPKTPGRQGKIQGLEVVRIGSEDRT